MVLPALAPAGPLPPSPSPSPARPGAPAIAPRRAAPAPRRAWPRWETASWSAAWLSGGGRPPCGKPCQSPPPLSARPGPGSGGNGCRGGNVRVFGGLIRIFPGMSPAGSALGVDSVVATYKGFDSLTSNVEDLKYVNQKLSGQIQGMQKAMEVLDEACLQLADEIAELKSRLTRH
ncbi:DDB1- and CUL4-associated factor 10-like [Dermochelys coriacea]|uniref:DDB1- and CUL4-associated factor 10-like n=1 Tax=Dermochelys coriacea TaxID=27794 RepID=UPI001CA8C81F|nr:DDB1- and CUL4-associated factor 10-like [Dermochelys coriacea]